MQFQSDILGIDVYRPECIETTALGAAYLAGLAVNFWKSKKEIQENWKLGHSFKPSMTEEKKTLLLRGWHLAVKCAQVYGEGMHN